MAIPADRIPFRVCLDMYALTVTMSHMRSAAKCEQIVASERRETAVIVPGRTHISAVVARLESNDAGAHLAAAGNTVWVEARGTAGTVMPR
jgi:precorrin-6B methylase 1